MTGNSEKGFTLIEVIVSLILLGIVSAIAGMGFVVVAKGYVFAKLNSEMVEKGQTAITRMVKELGDCTITAGTATSITFDRRSDGTTHTFSWAGASGNPLVLDPGTNNDTLIDNVNDFALAYYDNDGIPVAADAASQVEIGLQLIAADNSIQTFTNRVYIKV
ncbi:MAG: prepilin-type N-terminal cleavage/methylation domain-containing protein [Spirochaetales bacterium]|jgi:prepilin-type N-terminal cleavage/methylation domain-containing protein|nr:prepilin-type N-terminal cleavage/methylation domain-containing protein [Spirochaetales bacterium]